MATAIAERPAAAGQVLEELPLHLVDVGENVRKDAMPNGEIPAALAELAESIVEVGVLQPVRAIGPDANGRYELVWGQRRFLASEIANKLKGGEHVRTIPALVEPAADVAGSGAKRSLEQLIENIQRADLNAIDEAKALKAILDADPMVSQVGLAKRLGRSASWLANTLGLLNLEPTFQAKVADGTLTAAHAKAVSGLVAEDQADLGQKAIAQKWSAHELERQARWAKDNAKSRAEQRARTEKAAETAIAALTKTAAKDATILIQSYDSRTVAAALRESGWTNIRQDVGYGNFQQVTKAGECGCNAWVVDAYSSPAKVHPACVDKDHIAARRKAQDEQWAAEREVQAKARKAEEAAEQRRTAGLGEFLGARFDEPLARQLVLYALVEDTNDVGLVERYPAGDATDENVTDEDLWPAILRIPPDKLLPEIAAAAAASILGGWNADAEVLKAIDAALPPAEKPATDGALPRGICSACGREVALRKGRLVREHRPTEDRGDETICDGSGKAAA